LAACDSYQDEVFNVHPHEQPITKQDTTGKANDAVTAADIQEASDEMGKEKEQVQNTGSPDVADFNVRSAYDARKEPPEKQWWTANSSFTKCFETSGPAAKLDEFVGFTDKPYTRDFPDSSGKIVKVQVINSAGGNLETVWTYYKEKAQCEAEEVNATKSLADKYR